MNQQANHDTNLTLIRAQLLAGKRISVMSVLKSVGTLELRHYISELKRNSDLVIAGEWTCRNNKRFKEYYLKVA